MPPENHEFPRDDAPRGTAPVIEESEPIELTEFDISYTKEINAIPTDVRIIMEKIAFRLKRDGVTIDEACLLSNVNTEWLANQIEKYPIIARALAKKDLEYRIALMRPLNAKAKTDTKMAQYLLEMKNPPKRRNAAGSGDDVDRSDDMLAMAISHIQEHGDSSPLVRRESGAAVLITSGTSAAKLMSKIKNLLPKDSLA